MLPSQATLNCIGTLKDLSAAGLDRAQRTEREATSERTLECVTIVPNLMLWCHVMVLNLG